MDLEDEGLSVEVDASRTPAERGCKRRVTAVNEVQPFRIMRGESREQKR